MARLGWHVQTYTNLGILGPLADTIMKLPVTLVVDHFGRPKAEHAMAQPGLAEFLALLRSGKVYVKISAPYRISQLPDYSDAAPIAHAMIEANPDRIVWGSDWPHPSGAIAIRRRSSRFGRKTMAPRSTGLAPGPGARLN